MSQCGKAQGRNGASRKGGTEENFHPSRSLGINILYTSAYLIPCGDLVIGMVATLCGGVLVMRMVVKVGKENGCQ